MKQSPQIQARINTIAKELANGKSRAELLGKYGKKWELSRTSFDRYLKDAKIIAETLSEKANKIATDTFIEETKEAVKQGLKSKFERVMILQNEVDNILMELEANVTMDYIVVRGISIPIEKEISVTDRAYLRKTLKDLQAEISKIEGDYADTNVKHSGEVTQRLIIEDAQNCEPLNESYSSIQS